VQTDTFIESYADALREQSAAVFAGAGLSIPAGLINWAELMEEIAADLGLSLDREHDLVSIAQFHVNERGGRNRINQKLVSEFAERATLTDNHRILASLPIATYWTTNYDHLIEDALRQAHKRPDVKIAVDNLATTLPRRDAVVYKLHGDVLNAGDAIVTRDDYETFEEKRGLFSTALRGDLVAKTFLFIGFSFNDPNLGYILGRIRALLGANRRDHYALFRRVQREDFTSQEDFDYGRGRQDLQARDLRRYGIHGVLVDSYQQYTDVLRHLAFHYRRSRSFVSGSAAVYAPWTEEEAQNMLRDLGAAVIRDGFDLVTGFGLGVGPYVLNGVLESLEKEGTSSLHDRAILRPFPQGIRDPVERAERWSAYRREMIGIAGTAIFVFGNRRAANGDIETAAGVAEEFELAVAAGLAVVPVGCTGYMAEELHVRVLADFDRYYAGRPDLWPLIESLGAGCDRSTVAARVVDIIRRIRQR
jgi:hypothetical protein